MTQMKDVLLSEFEARGLLTMYCHTLASAVTDDAPASVMKQLLQRVAVLTDLVMEFDQEREKRTRRRTARPEGVPTSLQ